LIYDYDQEDQSAQVPITLKTRIMNMGSPYIKKRLWKSILRAIINQEAGSGQNQNIKVIGVNNDVESDYIDVTETDDTIQDKELANYNGSASGFKLELSGYAKAEDSEVVALEMNYELRQTKRLRR
jgi:hypothetical protein